MDILYEDNHIIAVNKQPSDIVQGDQTGDKPLSEYVKDYIKAKYQKPGEVFLGTVHRIDRPVSGVVLFARTSKALSRLNQLFKDKKIQKTYWALVREQPQAKRGTLTHYLKKNTQLNKSKAWDREVEGSRKAVLDYQVIKKLGYYHLLEVHLHTGRHHQIRVQLAEIGCPIKGDVKYGFKRGNADASIHLHARKVEFIHPVKKEPVCIVAPPPKDPLWDACV